MDGTCSQVITQLQNLVINKTEPHTNNYSGASMGFLRITVYLVISSGFLLCEVKARRAFQA